MIRINLLPVRVSKKKIAGKQQLILFALVTVLGVVGNLAWTQSRAGDLASRQAKLKRTKEEIDQLERIIGEVKNIKEEQNALKAKLDILDRLKAARSGPVRMLEELATITPKKVEIRKMDEKGGTMTFDGAAASIDDVSAFMAALKTSKYFTSVELRKTAAVTKNAFRIVDFTITAAVNYAPTAVAAAGTKPVQPGAPR